MSDTLGSSFSVLLPAARVALFVKDKDIAQAAQALRSDWRFARVNIDVQEGDVEAAIAHFAGKASPDVLLVETLEISEEFTGRLEVLAGQCSEDTAAVVIGPVNDVYLYRKLIDMGVSDYLVKPLDQKILGNVLAKILIDRLGAQGSNLTAIMGAKGGVGTSTLAYALARGLADDMGQKTIILDAAGGWSYLSVAMGAESVTNLHEAARASASTDGDSFRRMLLSVTDKLTFLATGAEALLDELITAEQYESLLNKLMISYPHVVVDLSGAPLAIRRSVLSRANHVVLVTTPTLPALRAARSLTEEIKMLRGGAVAQLHLIVNQRGLNSGNEISDSDIKLSVGLKPDLSLAFQPKIFGIAETGGKSLATIAGGKDIMNQILDFIKQTLHYVPAQTEMIGTTENTAQGSSSLLGGILGKLKTK
ncbi:MAG: cellulose synthase operon protein YhjQ/BcsQ [Pseudobdellovibrionaceae bacterium]